MYAQLSSGDRGLVLDIALVYFLTVVLHTQVVKALARLFDLILYIIVNNFSVISGWVFLGVNQY